MANSPSTLKIVWCYRQKRAMLGKDRRATVAMVALSLYRGENSAGKLAKSKRDGIYTLVEPKFNPYFYSSMLVHIVCDIN